MNELSLLILVRSQHYVRQEKSEVPEQIFIKRLRKKKKHWTAKFESLKRQRKFDNVLNPQMIKK